MVNIQNLVKKVKQLQPLSRVVRKVLTLADDPECGLKDLIHVENHLDKIQEVLETKYYDFLNLKRNVSA